MIRASGNLYLPQHRLRKRKPETGFIILRYGEVLLNYTEAKCELDGTIAFESLNLLRKKVGMPDFSVNLHQSDPNRVDYGYEISGRTGLPLIHTTG
jgi:hypothetical protein